MAHLFLVRILIRKKILPRQFLITIYNLLKILDNIEQLIFMYLSSILKIQLKIKKN